MVIPDAQTASPLAETEKSPSHILVTGASGFIGRALVDYLVQRGHAVTAVSRTPGTGNLVKTIPINEYTDIHRLSNIFRGQDTVIHLAALAHRQVPGNPQEVATAFAANVSATDAVAKACVAAGVRRLVLVSSIGVNGNRTKGHPFTESDAPQPAEPYAVSKFECELALRQVIDRNPSMEFVIIRPPLVYGPHAPGNFGKLLQAVRSRRWIPLGRIDNLRSLIGLENLLHFIELCARHPEARNQIYLVSDGEDVSTPGLIRRIATALRQPDRLLNLPLPVLRLIAGLAGRGDQIDRLVTSLQIDSTKARTQLGWAPPISLDEGLACAVRHTTNLKPPK